MQIDLKIGHHEFSDLDIKAEFSEHHKFTTFTIRHMGMRDNLILSLEEIKALYYAAEKAERAIAAADEVLNDKT